MTAHRRSSMPSSSSSKVYPSAVLATVAFIVMASLYLDRRMLRDRSFPLIDDSEQKMQYDNRNECTEEHKAEQHMLATLARQHPETATQLLSEKENADSTLADTTIAPLSEAIANLEGYPFVDMDFSRGPAPFCREDKGERCNCGIFKCFMASVNNRTAGYLVARNVEKTFQDMFDAYELEQNLIQNFGVSTKIALGKPILHKHLSLPMVNVFKRYGIRLKSKQECIVQKVLTIPEPSLYIGATGSKAHKTKQLLPGFVESLRDKNVNLRQFANRFRQEIKICDNVLQEVEGLRHDFQVVVGMQGEIYYIDLDRHFEIQGKDRTRGLMSIARIRHGLERILYWLVDHKGRDFEGLDEDDWWSKKAIGEE